VDWDFNLCWVKQTLLVCYAYDNFDTELKTHVPTIDKPSDTLKHLMSGLCFPLQHGITLKPEVIKQIPLTKTQIIPARTMSYSNSSVSGNIETILNLMEQGGVGDPNDMDTRYEVVDLSPFIIMFHGDLGTGDQIYSILQRWAMEKTAWNRFQLAILFQDSSMSRWCVLTQSGRHSSNPLQPD
jgi:hypothetical protein